MKYWYWVLHLSLYYMEKLKFHPQVSPNRNKIKYLMEVTT